MIKKLFTKNESEILAELIDDEIEWIIYEKDSFNEKDKFSISQRFEFLREAKIKLLYLTEQ